MFHASRFQAAVLMLATTSLLVAVAVAAPQDAAPSRKNQVPHDINKTFENPELDPQSFVDRFESESREVFAHREAIAKLLALKSGMEVADVGAGTGLFTLIFAETVKPDGKVYAVDIAPAFLKLIRERAAERGLADQVVTVQGGQDSTNLEPRSVDVVFICDTYHHFENHERMLRSIRRALRPGGRLVLVEFDREKAKTDFVEKHIRATRGEFVAEITAAGFEPVEIAAEDIPEFRENFLAVFRKVRVENPKRVDAQAPAEAVGARP